jgi:hypothetical protein
VPAKGSGFGAVSGEIVFDRVVDVGVRRFAGHVYGLQVQNGWYSTNGIIAHNCSVVPLVSGVSDPQWETGKQWFEKLTPEEQEAKMGPGLFAAWKDGKFELSDLAAKQHSDVWGSSPAVPSLASLLGGKGEAQEAALMGDMTIKFLPVRDETLAVSGYANPTDNERATFLKSVNELPDEVKGLWVEGDRPLVLARDNANRWAGLHQGNYIVLGKEGFEGGMARHEFVHHIVGQRDISGALPQYRPSELFEHAVQNRGGLLNQLDEDLTMMLSAYNKDREAWIDELSGVRGDAINGKLVTRLQAETKINETIAFMQRTGLWKR